MSQIHVKLFFQKLKIEEEGTCQVRHTSDCPVQLAGSETLDIEAKTNGFNSLNQSMIHKISMRKKKINN